MKQIILSALTVFPTIWLVCFLGHISYINSYTEGSTQHVSWISFATGGTIVALVLLCIATLIEIND